MLNGYSFRNDGNLESYMAKIAAGESAFSFVMKQPLLRQWGECGLLTFDGDWVDLTLAGRFWQVTMTIGLLEWINLKLTQPVAA